MATIVRPYFSNNELQLIEVLEQVFQPQFSVRRTTIFFEFHNNGGTTDRAGYHPAFLPCHIEVVVKDALKRVNFEQGTSYEMKDALFFRVSKINIVHYSM